MMADNPLEIKKLEDLATIRYGKNQKDVEIPNGKYKILGTGGVIGYTNDYLYNKPSVLIGRKGTIDNPQFIDEPFWTVDTLFYTEINPNVIPKWLYYAIRKLDLKRYNEATGVPSLSVKNLNTIKIITPPKKEQQKVAAILSSVDDAIEKTEQIIGKTETVKKGLMQQLLSKGIGHKEFKDTPIGKIPKTWEIKSLSEMIEQDIITSHLDGNHGSLYPRANEFVNEGIPYISANCLKFGEVDFDFAKHLTIERANSFKKGVAKNDDVLFAHNATVGPVAVLKTNLDFVILSTTLTYYRCNKDILNPYYLSYYMESSKFVNQYSRVMAQSTRNQVPITTQRHFYHVLPPLNEQMEIVEIMTSIDNKVINEKQKLIRLQLVKQGLMQQLLTGKIRVPINENEEVPS